MQGEKTTYGAGTDNLSPVLAIETEGRTGSVALVSGNGADAELSLTAGGRHSRHLLAAIGFILERTGLEPGDLAAIAVSAGPGSFTGLRIGMATARGLALAAGVPMYAVPTLDALAARLSFSALPVCAVSQARKNELYIARYRCRPQAMPERETEFLAMKPEDVRDFVREKTVFTGVAGYEEYGLAAILGDDFVPADPRLFGPAAAPVGMLCMEMMKRGEKPAADTEEPLYVKASQAEERIRGLGA